MSKVIRDWLVFTLLCYVIGLGNSRHFLNQSDSLLKPIASFACSYFKFSLAPRHISFAMIGCCDCSKDYNYVKIDCYREHDREYYGLCLQSVLRTSCINNVESIVIVNRSFITHSFIHLIFHSVLHFFILPFAVALTHSMTY